MKDLGTKSFCVMLHRVEDINILDGYIIKIFKTIKKKNN